MSEFYFGGLVGTLEGIKTLCTQFETIGCWHTSSNCELHCVSGGTYRLVL